ncbi:MAG: bifunctional phosphoribosyl-AMP cyclohydrolase/phosphoribosyl-ATP diphosphatase HisIE [Candidatus Aminicenantes bacterium]
MIISSIDLHKGKAVQLKQGRKKMLERDDLLTLAGEFSKFGEIAVVDLDAAFGNGNNDAAIQQICQVAECRVGGGIRSIDRATEILGLGAEKIIIGTKAFEKNRVNHQFLKSLCSVIGKNRVVVAIDSFEGEIVVHGWQRRTGLNFETVLKEVENYTSEFLFTCVEREGMMKGTDFGLIKDLRAATDLPITAAGGISALHEIEKLSRLGVNVQLGMALYTEKISLPHAFMASLRWDKDLIPTVTVDTGSQVLMLAYSSRESLGRTFETGRVWYFSRSRNKLWMKGETSGNFQKFLKVRTDCDGDALLMTVDQKGNACHTGTYSCFGNKAFSLKELYDVLLDRMKNPSPESYTSSLTEKALGKKIMEEAEELAEARKKEEIIWETADMLYFISVLLAKKDVPLDAVFQELKLRRRTPKKEKE